MRKKASYFTLLEVMIGLTLLLIIGSAVSWNVYKMIERSRFSTDVSKIISQIRLSRQMAINTRLDWKFEMAPHENSFRLQSSAPFSAYPPCKPSFTHDLEVRFEGKEIEAIVVYFSPTGKIAPEGVWELSTPSGKYHREISTFELFHQKELPDQEGPKHPEDVEAAKGSAP